MSLFKAIQLGYDPYYERILFRLGDTTFSYNPKNKGWISKHDYLPEKFFNTKRELYSSVDNDLYEHNHGNRGEYYDVVFDTVYEFVDNRAPDQSKIATTLWIDSSVYDADNKLELHKTFDAFQIFNKNQDTGVLDIEYFADNSDNPYIGNARKTQNKWFINQFRDLSNMPDNISADLEWAYKRRMQEHYQQIKLIKNNELNEKILLFRTNLIFKESIR